MSLEQITWTGSQNDLNKFFSSKIKKNGGNNLGLTSFYKGGYHKRDG